MIRRRDFVCLALLLSLIASLCAQNAPRTEAANQEAIKPEAPKQEASATKDAVNPAVVPADRMSQPWWAARHTATLEDLKRHPDARVIVVGDSITQNYEKSKEPDENFSPIWQHFYVPRKALNLGYSGDTTANLLWRLQNGEVDGISPKVAVVLIGTNNTARYQQNAVQAEAGIDAVVAELRSRLPQTRILLLGILPSAISASKTETDQAVNRYLADKYAKDARVTFLDIGPIFYEGGKLNEKIFYDARLAPPRAPLHPDTVGQRLMAEAVEPVLARLLGEDPIPPAAASPAEKSKD